MTNRTIKYFSKNKALKVIENPIQADLFTLLNASFALSRNNVVKNHMRSILHELGTPSYKLSA